MYMAKSIKTQLDSILGTAQYVVFIGGQLECVASDPLVAYRYALDLCLSKKTDVYLLILDNLTVRHFYYDDQMVFDEMPITYL